MARIESFSIPDEYEDIYQIVKAKKKDRTLSNWLCRTVRNQIETDRLKKIDQYVPQQTELETAPRIHEPITKDYLKTLSPKDVMRIRKMVYWNKKILDDYFDAYNNQYFSKLREDVPRHD